MAEPRPHTHPNISRQPNAVIYTYGADGWLVRSAGYCNGTPDGPELIFGPAGETLCTLPLDLVRDLERRELSAELRRTLAEHTIALPHDAPVTIVEPEREYLIDSPGQCYSIQVMDGYLAVTPGRLLRATQVEHGRIVARTHYHGGRLDGERTTYAAPGEPLFTLGLEFQVDFDRGDIQRLQPTFRQQRYALADNALIMRELPGREWRIIQSDQMLSVLHNGDALAVYPGRVALRTIFAAGHVIETAEYQAGRLHGAMTIYGPLGSELFHLDLALRTALDNSQVGSLVPIFQQHGHALTPDARLTTVLDGGEWFVDQIGQSYTIRRDVDELRVYPGRISSRNSYRNGKLDGITALYDAQGRLAQQMCYRDGLRDGPTTLYAAGVKQTLVTFQQGQKHGPLIAYDEQGRPTMISHYQHDLLDGELCLFKEGKCQALATYRGGVRHGRSIAYHPSGQENFVGQYANDQLHGESVLYSETGQVVKTSQYRAGKLEGVVIEYYPSGTVRMHATYHDNQLDGIAYVYDAQGRLQEKTHYRNGEPIGKPERRSWLQTLMQR